MARPVSDDTRREEILRRAQLGLREDIDDLRAELLDALPNYEQRLRRHTYDLPDWLKLAPAQLRQLFHFADDSVEPEGMLGPRTVALGAGRVEAFVEQWLEPSIATCAPPELDELGRDYAELLDYLDALGAESQRTAAEARSTLTAWLDAVLSQLDLRRESDVEALEALVREGEVGRGDGARQEIADLWEEQRTQAADLQARWKPVVGLLDEGAETSERGVEALRELVGRARDGLVGANDALEDRLPAQKRLGHKYSEAPTPSKTAEIDQAGPTEFDADAGETLQRHELPSEDLPAGDNGAEGGDQPISNDPQDTASAIDQASNTIPDADIARGIVPLEEPSSEPEMSTLETSSVSDYSEPKVSENGSAPEPPASRRFTRGGDARMAEDADSAAEPTDDASDADDRRGEQATPEATSVHEQKTLRLNATGSEAADSQPPTDASASDKPAANTPAADPIEAPCFRMRGGYAPVSGLEAAGVLLPPLVFLTAMGAACALYLLGIEAGFNPIERWSWAPAALTVAGAWVLFVPLGLSWRPRWSGWRLEILRHTDVRQDAELYVDDSELHLGEFSWPLDTLESRHLHRWDSPSDEAFGWLLRIEPPDHPPVEFAAAETNREHWQNSPVQLVDFPYQAWLVDPPTFRVVRERLLPRKSR